MDVHERCQSLVRAARRPLSLEEVRSALNVDDCLGEELEVSGGCRPIVHFKRIRNLEGSAADHEVAALCCMQAIGGTTAFSAYAIEYCMKHVDSAGEEVQARFLEEFDYPAWQRLAVTLPVYAAMHTYSFRGSMLRQKCFKLFQYATLHARGRLQEGKQSREESALRMSLSPWRGDFETRRRQREQQRELLVSSRTSWGGSSAAGDREALDGFRAQIKKDEVEDRAERRKYYSGLAASGDAGSSVRQSQRLASAALGIRRPLTPPSPTISTLSTDRPTPRSPAQSMVSFEDLGRADTQSESGLSEFEMLDLDEELSWEDVEYQEAIWASLQRGDGGASSSKV